MSTAKVTLSPKELELVNNSDWILTKNAIIAKVYDLFGQLSEAYKCELQKHSSLGKLGIDLNSAKIAKGEQYEGLPWVMLDHPRHFTTSETFAVRSFFWWGNYCSITLQLSGRFAEIFGGEIEKYFRSRPPGGWFYCINEDAWLHHFRGDNYEEILPGGPPVLRGRPFIKLAKKIPLTDWNRLTEFFENSYTEIFQLLAV